MLSKTILTALASAAAITLPLAGAQAQVAADVGVQTPSITVTDSVQGTTNQALDTAQGAADTVPDAVDETAVQADAGAQAGATEVATAADVKAGAKVLDPTGGLVGTIEKVDANGAVIATGAARVQIPIASFAKNDAGLVISLTKEQLETQARAAS